METLILITTIVRFTLVSGVLLVNGLCLLRLLCMLIKSAWRREYVSERRLRAWATNTSGRGYFPSTTPPTAPPPSSATTPVQCNIDLDQIDMRDLSRSPAERRPRSMRHSTRTRHYQADRSLPVCVHTVTTGFILVSSIVYLSSWLPYLATSLVSRIQGSSHYHKSWAWFGGNSLPAFNAEDHCVLQHSVTSQVTTVLLAILVVRKFYAAFSPSRARILSFAACIAWIIPQLIYLSAVDLLSHSALEQRHHQQQGGLATAQTIPAMGVSHVIGSDHSDEVKYTNKIINFPFASSNMPAAISAGPDHHPFPFTSSNSTLNHQPLPTAMALSASRRSSSEELVEGEIGLMICVHVLSQKVVSHLAWHYVVLVIPLTALIIMCFAVRYLKNSFNSGLDIKTCQCPDDILITLTLFFNFTWLLVLRPLIVLQSLLLAIRPPVVPGSTNPHHPLWDAIYWDEPPTYLDFGSHLVLIFACVMVPFCGQGGFRAALPPGLKNCVKSVLNDDHALSSSKVHRNRSQRAMKRSQSLARSRSRSRSSGRRARAIDNGSTGAEGDHASDPKRFYFAMSDDTQNGLTETSDISLPIQSVSNSKKKKIDKKKQIYGRSQSFRIDPLMRGSGLLSPTACPTPVQIGYISTEWARYRTPEIDYDVDEETKEEKRDQLTSPNKLPTPPMPMEIQPVQHYSATAAALLSSVPPPISSIPIISQSEALQRSKSYRAKAMESHRDETVETFNNDTIESLPPVLNSAAQKFLMVNCLKGGRRREKAIKEDVEASEKSVSGPGRPPMVMGTTNGRVLDDSDVASGTGVDTAMNMAADRLYVQTL